MTTPIGQFILELRKEQNMTQKQLAEKLHITDKAVSKWERGLGYPDISIIPMLASVLNVTTAELLNGKREEEKTEIEKTEKENKLMENVLNYVENWKLKQVKFNRNLTMLLITIAAIISISVCVIVDFAIERQITWSGIVIASVIFSWIVSMVSLLAKKNWWVYGLAAVTGGVYPLLYAIQHFTKFYLEASLQNWFFPLGVTAATAGLIGIWIMCIVFTYSKFNIWIKSGISMLAAAGVSIAIEFAMLSLRPMEWYDRIDGVVTLLAGIVLILFGIYRSTKAKAE